MGSELNFSIDDLSDEQLLAGITLYQPHMEHNAILQVIVKIFKWEFNKRHPEHIKEIIDDTKL